MQFNLRYLCRLPRLNSLKHNPLMGGHVLNIDILRPGEINFKIDILEILNIQRKNICQLLFHHYHFLLHLDARVQLLDLLF